MSYVNSIFMIYYIFKLSTFLGGENFSLSWWFRWLIWKRFGWSEAHWLVLGIAVDFWRFFHWKFGFWNEMSFRNFIFNLILISLASQTPTVLKRSTSSKRKASNCPKSPKVLHISQFSIKHVTQKVKIFSPPHKKTIFLIYFHRITSYICQTKFSISAVHD